MKWTQKYRENGPKIFSGAHEEQHMKVKTKIKAGDGTHGCETCLPPVHYP